MSWQESTNCPFLVEVFSGGDILFGGKKKRIEELQSKLNEARHVYEKSKIDDEESPNWMERLEEAADMFNEELINEADYNNERIAILAGLTHEEPQEELEGLHDMLSNDWITVDEYEIVKKEIVEVLFSSLEGERIDQLRELKQIFDSDLINEEDYNVVKAEILSSR